MRTNLFLGALFFLFVLAPSTGFAQAVEGQVVVVHVETTPAGAEAHLEGVGERCTTPCLLQVQAASLPHQDAVLVRFDGEEQRREVFLDETPSVVFFAFDQGWGTREYVSVSLWTLGGLSLVAMGVATFQVQSIEGDIDSLFADGFAVDELSRYEELRDDSDNATLAANTLFGAGMAFLVAGTLTYLIMDDEPSTKVSFVSDGSMAQVGVHWLW